MEACSDPFDDLATAACNLLADNIGVRHCGVIALDGEELRAASSEFSRLPPEERRTIVAAVLAGVAEANFDVDEAHSSRVIDVPVTAPEVATAAAIVFPETEAVVFQIPQNGKSVAARAFRRAATSALPIFDRIDGLRTERSKLLTSHELLAHVEELAKVGGWEHVLSTGRLIWSREIYAIHGLEPGSELSLDRVLQLYPSPAREKLSLELERAAADGSGFDLTTPIRTPAGERRIVRTVGRAVNGTKLYGITQDVTAQLSAERRLWWAANHDPVTSLPNRLLFEDRMATAVQRARRENKSFALVILDISDFARLTERAGYTVPDKHMMDVAARIAAVMRESDTIARVSLNEFAILLNDVKDRDALGPPIRRLREQIDEMQKEGAGDGIHMSVGIAFYPEHASGPEELTRAAEMALSQARRRLDNPIAVFDRQIANDAVKRRETILRRARDSLARREFVPYYQPQIDIETNEIVGVEALVRWQTPDMLLDAKDFAYALDDHEIGSRVGRAVLDAVITDIAKLRQITDRPFRVSINASRTEVLRNDFLDTFLEKTRNGNLKPNDFIIEITEDVIIGVDDQALHDKISFLVSSGVEFSLDDFGTGYASLIHITSFPVKEIKIDKQFIFGIETDRRKRAIVKGIIQIARSMGLHVIAEGVETIEQQEVLRDIGCRYAQGYLYSFPVPFSQFADMLDHS
ncbi:bifunctional diguanylate cyclase/phosphodiesterase [Acuticoccus sp. M5D2P5]|uniref:putative bifunctional diguanylate cyclase/phosphodiesterase n=1 Tax=Acuticoccus kalidii TaxID=2910977 RepID=UPI001F42E5D3|nr:bifunctional diguanylate cyclase/phosphodiesterase [Acuticoccus kalidii]MCF3933674.1 bifunctional diguanylate cyclase/phosphodiesterase [Acuticoccus kalidii]